MELPYWAGVLKEFLVGGASGSTSIPPLDAGLAPNDRLEELSAVDAAPLPAVSDIARSTDGDLYVSCGDEVVRFATEAAGREHVARLPGSAGAMVAIGSGGLLVCVAGAGLVEVSRSGETATVLSEVDGEPLHCPTGVAIGPDGVVYVTQGSAQHDFDDWVWDLMERNRSGRLIAYDPKAGVARVLCDRLAYPNGVALAPERDALLFTQAWDHSLSRYHLAGARAGQVDVVRDNLVGYPAGISPAGGGRYWLSFFALRTHLVDFILTQHSFRREMMRTIDPVYWVRPALRTLNSGLEPLQGGGIKKLGRTKPWAPPRSYGLLALIDADGEFVESLHSRADGRRHGVVSSRQFGDELFICCKGSDELLRATLNGAAA